MSTTDPSTEAASAVYERTLITVKIDHERDLVPARRRSAQIADLLGFDRQDVTRIATAVSEIARNAFQYASGGRVEYRVRLGVDPALIIIVSDTGPGIPNIDAILSGQYRSQTGMGMGIIGAMRLMASLVVETAMGKGTTVTMEKTLPRGAVLAPTIIPEITAKLAQMAPQDAFEEIRRQNGELMSALEELNRRQDELAGLNRELEDTNRGVVALYAELEERAERLRQADEIKSRFLSNMTHEFRTPLNSILALSRLLADRTDGDLSSEQEKQVMFIRKSAQELLVLVNDLLDLAKVEAGRTELNIAEFDVQNLFGALRGVLKPLLNDESVALVFEPPPPGLIMDSDEGKISQILRNLISNALKFTEQGEVRISVRPSEDGKWVTFLVADTGIGIAREHLSIIFEEFGQVRNRFQQQVKGTGLGLPLSRRLAELLGGTLLVESTSGSGSTFSVTLPATYGSTGNQHRDMEQRPIPVALVIDDEDATRYYVSRMAADVPCSVIAVENGAKGIEAAVERSPDIILLDLVMPAMDGFAVIHHLKANASTSEIPVVVVTSKTLTVDEQRFLDDRRIPMLSKETLTRQMIAAIVDAKLNRRYHAPVDRTDR